MSIRLIVVLIFYAILTGGIYGLISVGLSLIYGIMKIVNFAQGEFFMLAAFVCYFMMSFNVHPILAVMTSCLITFLAGVLLEKTVISPLRRIGGREWLTNTLVATLGVSLSLQNIALLAWGAYQRGISYMWSTDVINLYGIPFSVDRLVILLVSLLTLTIFYLFIRFTRIGMAIRAVAQNKNAAMALGININTVYVITCGLSVMLGGLAGALMLPISSVYHTVGTSFLLVSFVVIILGGMGSLVGTALAAFVVGIINSFSAYFFGMGWSRFFLFILIAIILLIRPWGILGEKQID